MEHSTVGILRWIKYSPINLSKGNFEADMTVSNLGIIEMKWWLCNLCHSFNVVDVTLYSDASLMGWGDVMDKISTKGRWSTVEARKHITYLELLTALFTPKCFHPSLSGKHVKLMIDNTTAVAVTQLLSKFGNSVHNITWITAAHIPGSL